MSWSWRLLDLNAQTPHSALCSSKSVLFFFFSTQFMLHPRNPRNRHEFHSGRVQISPWHRFNFEESTKSVYCQILPLTKVENVRNNIRSKVEPVIQKATIYPRNLISMCLCVWMVFTYNKVIVIGVLGDQARSWSWVKTKLQKHQKIALPSHSWPSLMLRYQEHHRAVILSWKTSLSIFLIALNEEVQGTRNRKRL